MYRNPHPPAEFGSVSHQTATPFLGGQILWRLLLVGLAGGLSALADEPKPHAKRPMYERLLQGDDAKRAEELKRSVGLAELLDKFDEAIKWQEELLALRTNVQGADHWQTINQSSYLVATRKQAALSPEERAGWRKAERGSGEAKKLQAQHRYAQAQPLLDEHARWCERIFGADHPYTATSHSTVADNLAAQGKYAQAQSLYQASLETLCKVFGEGHPLTAASHADVAGNLDELGKHAEAELHHRNSLEVRRQVLGEEHQATAASYNAVAFNLKAQARYAEAQPLFQKALDLRRKLFGNDHERTAMSYNNVASNLDAQGKIIEAQQFFQRALDIHRRRLGEVHSDTALSYGNLGANLNDQGKYHESQSLFQRALDIRRKLFGELHPSTAMALNNLAMNLKMQGKHDEAHHLFKKALRIDRQVLGEEHPDTAIICRNLASNLNDQGKYAEARPFYELAFAIQHRTLGEDHPDVAITYNHLARDLVRQQEFVQARRFNEKALAIHLKTLGENHPSTGHSHNHLANTLNSLGEYADAQVHFDKALATMRKALGEEHADTALCYSNLGFNLSAQREFAQAQSFHQKALEIRRRVLGEAHPSTTTSYNNLAINLTAQHKNYEAEAVLERAIHSNEASRLAGASGIERAMIERSDPRIRLAALRATRDPEAAWEAAELSLARGLLDEQASRTSKTLSPDEIAEQARWRSELADKQAQILVLAAVSRKSDDQDKQLEELIGQRRSLEDQLVRQAVRRSQREVARPATIRAVIPHDAALLFWIDASDNSRAIQEHWGCVVRPTGEPKWERLPGTGSDKEWTLYDSDLVAKCYVALAKNGTHAECTTLAKALFDQRLAPLAKHLTRVRRLYVVPVNRMAGIPIEALTSDYAISYVPSGTFLARLKDKPPPAGKNLLTLGDPVFTSSGESQKPATELPPGGLLITQVAVGGAAAKARLQAGDVLVQYGDHALATLEQLDEAMQSHATVKEIIITAWREGTEKLFSRAVAPGKLGVVFSKEPAREAVASRRKTDEVLLAVRGGNWKELPGTRVELTGIQKLFGSENTVLVDSQASEQTLETLRKNGDLAKFRYLHFATHGETNDERAFESALILAQDTLPKDSLPQAGGPFINGQLSAQEVLDYWKLDAELVTLSACETALGRLGGGEGMLGFAQAFLTAGSRSVCLSLWKVDDTATCLLMQRFYQNLLGKRPGLGKPLAKAEALAEAKKWLRELSAEEALKLTSTITDGVARRVRGKDEDLSLVVPSLDPKEPAATDARPFAHPRYWAAFVLIGDPN